MGQLLDVPSWVTDLLSRLDLVKKERKTVSKTGDEDGWRQREMEFFENDIFQVKRIGAKSVGDAS